MKKQNVNWHRLAIFLGGLAFVFFAHMKEVALLSTLTGFLEAIGFAMMGYTSIGLIVDAKSYLSERKTRKAINRLFSRSIRIVSEKETLPIFITTDLEGCITPPYRTKVDLMKLQSLRSYCQFVKTNREFPQLVIFTGRSQGYVEFLVQALDIFNSPHDLPFVIENGAALYHINARKTQSLLSSEQSSAIQKAKALLQAEFRLNEFEPKSYMVTVNPCEGYESDDLREKVTLFLEKKTDLFDKLAISSTASAVDINSKGINKLFGLEQVLSCYPKDKERRDFISVTALGDSISDLEVLKRVGSAYCSSENVHGAVRKYVEDKFGESHVIQKPHIDFVLRAIENECGIRFL